MNFGAQANGIANDAPAIQSAIDACTQAGGGKVIVPAGNYLCAAIELKSNVELHLENGAAIIASHDEALYEAQQGLACLIGAKHAHDVALTGLGKIDGRGRLVNYNDHADHGFEECPLAFRGFRPRTTLFEDIENLTVQGVTFCDSALWTLHMAGCRNVICDSIKILNDDRAANNDGIDPDCCQGVVIKNCIVFTGDDAIVVKTSKQMAPFMAPVKTSPLPDACCIRAILRCKSARKPGRISAISFFRTALRMTAPEFLAYGRATARRLSGFAPTT
jgi:polygalacturonase